MIPKIIKTEQEYHEYLNYIESVFHKELSDEESNNVEVISALIEIYENSKEQIEVEGEKFDDNITIDYIYDLVKLVSPIERSDITKKGLKLTEEVGELSAEILKLVNYKYHNDNPEQIRENLLQEAVDSLIMIFDILTSQNYLKEEVVNISEQKIEKWLNQINNK
jgi:hypothetical protein